MVENLEILTEMELAEIEGGINWDDIAYGVGGIGAVAAACSCPPVVIVAGAYEASYWITKGLTH